MARLKLHIELSHNIKNNVVFELLYGGWRDGSAVKLMLTKDLSSIPNIKVRQITTDKRHIICSQGVLAYVWTYTIIHTFT